MFKITIQPGSELDREISALSPRQRNSRLIELATMGLAFSRSSVTQIEPATNSSPINTKKHVDDFVTCEKMTAEITDAKLVTAQQNSVTTGVIVSVGNTDFGADLLSM